MRGIQLCWGLFALLSGCEGWFQGDRSCRIGASSCDGDRVRVCVPDAEGAADEQGPATRWTTTDTCPGVLTCGVVAGEARCIDGARAHDWRQVEVSMGASAIGLHIGARRVLQGVLVGASSGVFAAVSHRGDERQDAALVPFEAGRVSRVWLRTTKATHVSILDVDSKVLADAEIGPGEASAALVQQSTQALSPVLPPTLRVLEPTSGAPLPPAWSRAGLRAVSPSDAALDQLAAPLSKLPLRLVSAFTAVGFASGSRTVPATTTERMGTSLWVDASTVRMKTLESDPGARSAFRVELAGQATEAYAERTAINVVETPAGATHTVADFPAEIGALLQARLTPLLRPGESLASLWGGLHQIAVRAGIAAPFDPAWATRSDREAVHAGFASARGGTMPVRDFAEYLARAMTPEAWRDGPCDDIRGHALDELPPRLLVPVAKLELLWGLGLLDYETLVQCVGTLPLRASEQGVALKGPGGAPVTFDRDVQGVRTRDLQGAAHVAAVAGRGELTAVLDVMYRSGLPGVIRIGPSINARAQEVGASLAITSARDYLTAPASAGLLRVTKVTPTRIEAHGLMVTLAKPVLGANVFPLVTVRIDNPAWPPEQR